MEQLREFHKALTKAGFTDEAVNNQLFGYKIKYTHPKKRYAVMLEFFSIQRGKLAIGVTVEPEGNGTIGRDTDEMRRLTGLTRSTISIEPAELRKLAPHLAPSKLQRIYSAATIVDEIDRQVEKKETQLEDARYAARVVPGLKEVVKAAKTKEQIANALGAWKLEAMKPLMQGVHKYVVAT